MKSKILYWVPRVLGILFAVFISLFSLDVFGEYGFPIVLVALFMHNVPTFILIGVLLIAWKWNFIGGILYVLLGLFYILMMRGDVDLIVFLMIPGVVFLVGVLFMINHVWKVKKK